MENPHEDTLNTYELLYQKLTHLQVNVTTMF